MFSKVTKLQTRFFYMLHTGDIYSHYVFEQYDLLLP